MATQKMWSFIFALFFRDILQFHCKIYAWRWCEPNLTFFMVISITLSFQIKKIKFQKFCPHEFLWPQSINKISRFCSCYHKMGWLGPIFGIFHDLLPHYIQPLNHLTLRIYATVPSLSWLIKHVIFDHLCF